MPFRSKWGPYRISIQENANDDSRERFRLQIQDLAGRTLRVVRAWKILSVEPVSLLGDKPDELEVELWTGGAYSAFTQVFFSRKNGVHNLLVFNGNTLGVRKIAVMKGEKLPVIVTEDPILNDFKGYYFHRASPVITLFGWNGSRYVNVTSRHPVRALREARKDRAVVEVKLEDYQHEQSEFEWLQFFHDAVSAYYANMLAAGHGAEARSWLRAKLRASDWKWVRRYDLELRKLIANAGSQDAYCTQAMVIRQPE